MESSSGHHQPVLLTEVLERLDPKPGEVHADCTTGPAGHASKILEHIGPEGFLIGIDRDRDSIELATARLAAIGSPFRLFCGVFTEIREFCKLSGFSPDGALDGVLFDLGVSSLQLDRPARGFSFLRDGPLDMRMSPDEGVSAAEFLRTVPVEELRRVLWEYGEESASGKVARAIDAARHNEELVTTGQLARVVENVLPRRGKKIHPATRTFQAIRIAINRELENLRLVLRNLDRVVKPGGRVVVLSYHSLEDRIVKTTLQSQVDEKIWSWLRPTPLRPSEGEVAANPRARSAKLRAVVRSGGR